MVMNGFWLSCKHEQEISIRICLRMHQTHGCMYMAHLAGGEERPGKRVNHVQQVDEGGILYLNSFPSSSQFLKQLGILLRQWGLTGPV